MYQAEEAWPAEFEEPLRRGTPNYHSMVNEQPPPLDLKPLPRHLGYAFIEENQHKPIIIASGLSLEEKVSLVEVLKKNKNEIYWRINNIKGISPSYWSHRIIMEEEANPVVQTQRRINPKMQEAVKKEVIKLMDAGIIYSISDSPWISPIVHGGD